MHVVGIPGERKRGCEGEKSGRYWHPRHKSGKSLLQPGKERLSKTSSLGTIGDTKPGSKTGAEVVEKHTNSLENYRQILFRLGGFTKHS